MPSEMGKILGLGEIQRERSVPGRQEVAGREFRYILDDGGEPFSSLFKRLIRHVQPPLPTSGAAMIEGCAVTLPKGEVWQAISYKGDLLGWRRQIGLGAESLNVNIASLSGDTLVLPDGKMVDLADCKTKFY
ncbi:hypothetical protein [Paraburkholderia terricola]|uniref:Uncharacterized protein n=1 Tax=Paraburkholderia terricola TaxID=169427 RepID=A0ABU1LXI4_9BURK|nr:hypothetical protein [Paraburkholderia terricola]MDR6411296.1 hypothetical protein [Paraburkholderia terricola]MDR6483464.1 hypothetical protein [Paraburkholderia terricola]